MATWHNIKLTLFQCTARRHMGGMTVQLLWFLFSALNVGLRCLQTQQNGPQLCTEPNRKFWRREWSVTRAWNRRPVSRLSGCQRSYCTIRATPAPQSMTGFEYTAPATWVKALRIKTAQAVFSKVARTGTTAPNTRPTLRSAHHKIPPFTLLPPPSALVMMQAEITQQLTKSWELIGAFRHSCMPWQGNIKTTTGTVLTLTDFPSWLRALMYSKCVLLEMAKWVSGKQEFWLDGCPGFEGRVTGSRWSRNYTNINPNFV
jgi:hypothetical protein